MKNPLIKRLPRELKSEAGKYIIIFVFMIIVIGFVSGFLVASGSGGAVVEATFGAVVCWGFVVTGGSSSLFLALFIDTVMAIITASAATRRIAVMTAARFTLVSLVFSGRPALFCFSDISLTPFLVY